MSQGLFSKSLTLLLNTAGVLQLCCVRQEVCCHGDHFLKEGSDSALSEVRPRPDSTLSPIWKVTQTNRFNHQHGVSVESLGAILLLQVGQKLCNDAKLIKVSLVAACPAAIFCSCVEYD